MKVLPSEQHILLFLWLATSSGRESRSRGTVTGFVIAPLTRSLNAATLQANRRDQVAFTTFLSARKQHHKRKRPPHSSSGRGFLSSSTHAPSLDDTSHGDILTLIQNLFLVCGHLQNPDLYSSKWADHVHEQQPQIGESGTVKLVASTDVSQGAILSLYPIHDLSLLRQSQDEGDGAGRHFMSSSIQSVDSLILPLEICREGSQKQSELSTYEVLISYKGPIRLSKHWRGHLATRWMSPDERDSKYCLAADTIPNCVATPLPGAAPLCGLVATRNIEQGEELIVEADREFDVTMISLLQQRYEQELSELRGYLSMAYPSYLKPVISVNTASRLATGQEGMTNGVHHRDGHNNTSFQAPFHTINMDYPGLRYIHRNPDILLIDDFLSADECESIMAHAEPHLIPCVIKHPVTGQVKQDPSRTSTNVNLPQGDVPGIVDKLVQLARCPDPTYLETLQILRYTQGQHFAPHTDGFDGPTTACGYYQSGRLVTIFCYLNNVTEGGTTVFTRLNPVGEQSCDDGGGLVIQPRQGTAVIHFPATTGFEEDQRTEHQGSEAMGHDKWILTTWMWKNPRTDARYHESIFPSILNVTVPCTTLDVERAPKCTMMKQS